MICRQLIIVILSGFSFYLKFFFKCINDKNQGVLRNRQSLYSPLSIGKTFAASITFSFTFTTKSYKRGSPGKETFFLVRV